MMRTFLTCLVATAILLSHSVPADAQALKLTPRVGVYVPLTDLGTREDIAQTVALDNSLAFGLSVEFALPVLPFNLRANLDYATDAAVTQDGVDQDAGRTTVLAVTGDAVFRLPRIIVLQPYLFAGGGLKQYGFDTDAPEAFRDSSDPTLHLGGGFDLGFRSFALTAQIGDYISWHELREGDSQIQHDLFVTLGVSFGLF
jgi:hypothetical protein